MADWQKIELKIPSDLKPAQREELGDLIVEHIYDRTNRGLDKNGREFPGYSAAYKASLDFKNAGKSASKIDLQLSGDMMAALQLLKHKNGAIVVGFERGTEENAKAEGNILGTYGRDKPIRGKKRDFLGIESRKLRELIDYVRQGS
jgi:hypothetical protein